MFKLCTMCEKAWGDRDDFLSDPEAKIIGYQVNFGDLQLGYFLFNHLACQTTLAIHAARFIDLYQGPIYAQPKTGTPDCTGHCLRQDDLEPCDTQCECAYVREIIQIISNWPAAQDQTARSRRTQST